MTINKYYDKHGIKSLAGSSKKDSVFFFLDSDYASNFTDQKSCQRAVFLLQGGAIAYKSEKQKLILSSTATTEYIALAIVTKMAIWLREIVTNIERFRVTNMNWIKNQCQSCLWIRKLLGSLEKVYPIPEKSNISTLHSMKFKTSVKKLLSFYNLCLVDNQMLADRFTKPLPRVIFEVAYEKI